MKTETKTVILMGIIAAMYLTLFGVIIWALVWFWMLIGDIIMAFARAAS